MKKYAVIALGLAMTGMTGVSVADEGFAGVTVGQTSNNIHKPRSLDAQLGNPDLDGVIHRNSTWGARVGQQTRQQRYYLSYDHVSSERREYKLRQQNLLGSVDALLPVGEVDTVLFAGVSAGVVRLGQESSGFRSHSDNGWAAGLQGGVLQEVGDQVSLEAGYRYLRTTADVRLQPSGDTRTGRMALRSSGQAYLGVNYRF